MMTITCVIIDDEPLARECIANYVADVDFLRLVGTGSDPVDLLKLLETQSPDLIFLDIQMPIMNGIDFLKTNTKLPFVIITTAYPSYALEGFQLDVMDYLVKPIVFNRFFQAITKVKEYQQLVARSLGTDASDSSTFNYFFVKCGHTFERIYFDDLLYVEALQNYVTLHTQKGKYITQLPLKTVEQNLEGQPFIRVHKSYIVSIPKIEAIENNDVLLANTRIPISRLYRDNVMSRVVSERLWKK